MCDRYYVVSTVEVGNRLIPRILFQDADETVCQARAEQHWNEVADPDELVFVMCNHDKSVEVAQAIPVC